MDASRGDLISGPTVLVPPKQLMATLGDANETAMSFERAKMHLEEATTSSEEVTPRSSSPVNAAQQAAPTDQYAFAFDIDGVLIRGGKPIPAAVEAMKVLNGENPYGIKV